MIANEAKAVEFLAEARKLMARGAKEAPLRKKLEQYLPQIFPENPWWVKIHAEGAEKHTKFVKGGTLSSGFVDTLVGATSVEYESNLNASGIDEHAQGQVRDYIAGQLNEGVAIDLMIGVTSDTLRWRAFRPSIKESISTEKVGRDDIELEALDSIDLVSPHNQDAAELVRFLTRWLGRSGSRPLLGKSLAEDLGLETPRGQNYRGRIDEIEGKIRGSRPDYGDMIDTLWAELVDAIGRSGNRSLGRTEYLDEFYLLTLAKLICANVLDRAAINRSDEELATVLSGEFFSGRGLNNYVEYDLFGWLSENPAATGLLELARDIQNDLIAYDFNSLTQDDLFGELLARLGRKSTRLILGQELTPPWLARQMVEKVADDLGEAPLKAVDLACGSGTILVEVIRIERARHAGGETAADKARRIAEAATGFDIDPLAALFAKTNWVIAMRDELPHLGDTTIPVFQADSLFAGLSSSDPHNFKIRLDSSEVAPPLSLLAPDGQRVFDQVLSLSYREAMKQAEKTGEVSASAARAIAEKALESAHAPGDFSKEELEEFAAKLIVQLAELQKAGRNGLWTYIIRNTSRPQQMHRRFNAMIINPPWLSMSKLKDNPYGDLLDGLASALGVRPEGQSFLHSELASVFLLEGVNRYLCDGARVACIVPSTLAEGHHQNRFRTGQFAKAPRKVDLDIDGIWKVAKGTFKNEAIVLHGAASPFVVRKSWAGSLVSNGGSSALPFHAISADYASGKNRVIWTDQDGDKVVGFGFEPASFRQGADLMPRTTWFHDLRSYGPNRFKAHPIEAGSDLRYLLSDAKKATSFRLPAGTIIESDFVSDAVLSKQLIPFELGDTDRVVLPTRFDSGSWRALNSSELVAVGAGFAKALDKISKELGASEDELFGIIDWRGKLRRQNWRSDSYLVLVGAGGANPCAAWIEPGRLLAGEVVFDQTVYWAAVPGKEEAAYLSGAINSPACAALVAPFQPSGAKGKRHVHKLAISATPKFDPENASHIALAEATLALVDAWKAWAFDPGKAAYMRDKNKDLAWRRRKTVEALRALEPWAAYAAAAEAVFGD